MLLAGADQFEINGTIVTRVWRETKFWFFRTYLIWKSNLKYLFGLEFYGPPAHLYACKLVEIYKLNKAKVLEKLNDRLILFLIKWKLLNYALSDHTCST
jgi:hypothetical protein